MAADKKGPAYPRREKVRLAQLVHDEAFYPRHVVSTMHVRELVQAYGAGKDLPPIVVEADTYRIVDGVHRTRALLDILGPDGVATVEVRQYACAADLMRDVAQRNAEHGLRYGLDDRVRCVALLEHYGVPPKEIALALSIRTEDLPALQVRIFEVPPQTPGMIPGTNKVAVTGAPWHQLRRTPEHTLTREQARALESAPGTNYPLLIRQLDDGLQYGFVSLNARTTSALRHLRDRLGDVLADLPEEDEDEDEDDED
jgi:hypothetical protein